jgi:arylsulfatase A-like enzyme
VLVVVAALRPDVLGDVETPAFDRLARDGVSFQNAFSQSADTVPALASLFSSRLPHRLGVTANNHMMPDDVLVLPQWLGSHGWRSVASVGLATMWPVARGRGLDRGFKTYEQGRHEISSGEEVVARVPALLDGAGPGRKHFLFVQIADPHHPYEAHATAHGEGEAGRQPAAELRIDGELLSRFSIADSCWWSGETRLGAGKHEVVVSSETKFHLRRFELSIGGRSVKTDLDEIDPQVAAREQQTTIRVPAPGPRPVEIALWIHDSPTAEEIRRRYRLEVAAADAALGKLLAELDRRGAYDTSLIVLTADHGEGLGEHGVIGHSQHLFDELLHVTLVIKLPLGHAKARALATTAEDLARHVDVLPTLADLLALPPPRGIQGVSLFDRGERVLIAETHPPQAPRHLVALRDLQFKMIYDVRKEEFSMYDLVLDPGETRDVFAQRRGDRASWPEVLRLSGGK